MQFEHRQQRLLPWPKFIHRVARSAAVAGLMIAASLLLGMAGYHWIAGLHWIDSLLNASMILTGMGPVDHLEGAAAKLFASFYAIFSGVAFLTIMGVLLAPVFHRFLHKFHLG
ncbi:MAG TPA: hypothetical protein VMJ70_03605, partial [Candidatus Sulfotelmatobacter sp.]|nr:hypothetical protein [Candidatus Sulfotelmatobacter sp.]